MKLRDFVDQNPKIRLSNNVIAIPNEVRLEFYQFFDTVREVFVKEKFGYLINEAESLCEHYMRVEREVTELLGLERISMLTDLYRFLHHPRDSLTRQLHSLLFDLLRGKIDSQTFEGEASRKIETTFGSLYRLGYEKWVILSLIKLLKADKAFHVSIKQLAAIDEVFHDELEKRAPLPEESKQILFEDKPFVVMVVPDSIIHSARINKYVALRAEPGKATVKAYEVSQHRQWFPLNHGESIKSDLLIYTDDRPDDLALIADAKRVARPDLTIECMEQRDWPEKEGLEKVKLYHDILKPTLGTYVVSRMPVPQQLLKGLMTETASQEPVNKQESGDREADIHILTVAFNEDNLEPIIGQLMNQSSRHNIHSDNAEMDDEVNI